MNKKKYIIALVAFIIISLTVITLANYYSDYKTDAHEVSLSEKLANARLALEKALSSSSELDVNEAIRLINELEDSEEKTKMLESLRAINIIPDEPTTTTTKPDSNKNEVTTTNKSQTNTTTRKPTITKAPTTTTKPVTTTTTTKPVTTTTTPTTTTTTTTAVEQFTVTFNTDGAGAISAQTIEKGSVASRPADPAKTGFNFLGWYIGNNIYNFSNIVTGNITLTAKWEAIVVTPSPVYTLSLTKIDPYSPMRKITVYKDGINITNQISTINGISMPNGAVISVSELTGNTFTIRLTNAVVVTATKI